MMMAQFVVDAFTALVTAASDAQYNMAAIIMQLLLLPTALSSTRYRHDCSILRDSCRAPEVGGYIDAGDLVFSFLHDLHVPPQRELVEYYVT